VLLAALLEGLSGETALCVATDLTLASESIRTQSVAAWREARHPIGKRPTVFLMLSG
jgi:16S rRNA (cytidine1402-2'-O)-methyltransferase